MVEKSNKLLSDLIKDAPSIEIEELFNDSRLLVSNGMFFCVKGLINDGHHYVDQAIENGAVAIVYHDDLESYADGIFYYQVEDVNVALNDIASKFYDNPSDKLSIFATTGTNGKTTVSMIIKDILSNYESVGYIGTINIEYANKTIASSHTTPDVIDLQRVLSNMVNEKVKALTIEVSSHALEQKRTLALDYDYAIYTNLSHEHLDYHGSMDNYFQAKAKLFLDKDNHISLVNIDDEYGKVLFEEIKANKYSYAIDSEADFQAINIEYGFDKTVFTLVYKDKEYLVESNLVARFNVYNLLAAISALVAYGLNIEAIILSVKKIKQISGRVERIVCGQPFEVIVDYAHTPEGFESILKFARSIAEDKKIISVFGSAGQRDILKRKILGEVASEFSDMIILTEDDPRNESVLEISREIASGITTNYIVVENRYDAIYQAVELANQDDIILILGKGDDRYMARQVRENYAGDVSISKEIIREYLRENDYHE